MTTGVTTQNNITYLDYSTYLQSAEWRKKRKQILIFWGHKCALCSSKTGVEVHHNNYTRLGHELMSDLIPLCETCHERHHDYLRPGEPEAITTVLERIYENMATR